MDLDKAFVNINENHQSLWERLQEYADELDLQPEDQAIFVTEEQAKVSFYINNYFNNLVAVGVHLARLRKIRQQLQDKKDRMFGALYVKVTLEGVNGRNSSKFDKEYRTGKVLEDLELKKTMKLVTEVTEWENILATVKDGLQMKSMILPTLFKLDKYNF